MEYEANNYSYLLGLEGFSDQLLKNHFTLYQGYVTNTNKLIDILNEYLETGQTTIPQYAELKRRFGWEFDGMRLHELYFSNLTKNYTPLNRNSDLMKMMERDFGSYEAWETDFKAVGKMRGVGWSVLYYDPRGNRLFNTWIAEHDGGHLVEGVPLLIMDVWEHAYMIEYGLDRPAYIESFFRAISWEVVVERFEAHKVNFK